MSNDETTIEPALSAEEWSRISRSPNRFILASVETVDVNGEQRPLWRVVATKDAAAKGIAVTNDLLDHADPRKITREKIDALRSIIESAQERTLDPEPASRAFLDALASYLPREG